MKPMLFALATLGGVVPMTGAGAADVRPAVAHDSHHRLAGPFRSLHAAEDYAHTLRDRGFTVERIEAR